MTFFHEFLLVSLANKPEVLERDKQFWTTSAFPFGQGRFLSKADVEVASCFRGHPGKFEFDEDEDLSEVEGLMGPDSLT